MPETTPRLTQYNQTPRSKTLSITLLTLRRAQTLTLIRRTMKPMYHRHRNSNQSPKLSPASAGPLAPDALRVSGGPTLLHSLLIARPMTLVTFVKP